MMKYNQRLELVSGSSRKDLLVEVKELLNSVLTFVEEGNNGSLPLESKGIRKLLEKRERGIRKALEPYVSVPSISYYITRSKTEVNSYTVTFSRSNRAIEYKNFAEYFIVDSSNLGSIRDLEEFQEGIFLKLVEEAYILHNLTYLNSFYRYVQIELTLPYSLVLVPEVFHGSKKSRYVDLITDTMLVVPVRTELLDDYVDMLQSFDESSFYSALRSEMVELSVRHSTVELLGNKTPLLSYVMNAGRLGIAKLLKPTYSKTLKQLSTYPNAKGYGYYLEGGIFGVVQRSEYGTNVVLSPIDLTTYLRVPDVDLLDLIESGNL